MSAFRAGFISAFRAGFISAFRRLPRGSGCATLLASACAVSSAAPPEPPPASHGTRVEYSFPAVGEDLAVNAQTMHGRPTALVFITTYDLASQLLARRLGEVIRTFTPRANAAAIVVEPPTYAELLPAYREALSLPYPVVMADFATQRGSGPFGTIARVPTLIILDREGREVSRHAGSLDQRALEAALRRAAER